MPHKGSPETTANTISGNVQFSFFPVSTVVSLVTAGRLTALGVSTKTRSPVMPNVPALAEAGLPGFDFSGWYVMLAPAGTPSPIKLQLAGEITKMLAQPETRERLLSQGATPNTMTPDQLDAFIRDQVTRMAKVVQAAGLRVE